MSAPCFVYVIAIEGQDLCKIGMSNNPHARLKQLMTGSAFSLRLVQALKTPDIETARLLEIGFHKAMRDHRKRGEWFRLNSGEAVELMAINYYALLRKHFDFEQGVAVAVMDEMGVPFDLACWVANAVEPVKPVLQ